MTCQCINLECIDSRPMDNLVFHRKRRQRCKDCGELYTTVEIVITSDIMGKGAIDYELLIMREILERRFKNKLPQIIRHTKDLQQAISGLIEFED